MVIRKGPWALPSPVANRLEQVELTLNNKHVTAGPSSFCIVMDSTKWEPKATVRLCRHCADPTCPKVSTFAYIGCVQIFRQ